MTGVQTCALPIFPVTIDQAEVETKSDMQFADGALDSAVVGAKVDQVFAMMS